MNRNAKIDSFPAPIGGLNVADSLVAMPVTDAITIRNMFSRPYGLEVRKGNVRHCTGLGAGVAVGTLVSHNTARTLSASKLYAFAGTEMFEITVAGNVARVAVLNLLSNALWNGVSVSNASGLNQTLYNGADNGIWIKDDFAIARITQDLTGTPPIGTIFGVDPKTLIGGTVHQKRVWLVQKDTTKAWYLPPEAIFGVATSFDFGSIFQRGGSLKAIASWTLDSGTGMDDVFVAISSMGEIAIYSGTNPAAATTWELMGVFNASPLVSDRCLTKVDGDLVMLTKSGLMSLAAAIAKSSSSGAEGPQYLSGKIQYRLQGLAETLAAVAGWSLVYWPANSAIAINVPMSTGSGQFMQSTITKGWSQFDGWNAVSMILHDGILMYGDRTGNVWRAWEGYTDGAIQVDAVTTTLGEPILAEVQTSFNFFGSPGTVKHAKMLKPVFIGSGRVDYKVRINPEFSFEPPISPGTIGPVAAVGNLWGVAVWGTDKWGNDTQVTQRLWAGVDGVGTGFAVNMAFRANTSVIWASYDFMYSEGVGI